MDTMTNDIKQRNEKVQQFGWATLIMLIGFMGTLFGVTSWLVSPLCSEIALLSGRMDSIHECVTTLHDALADQTVVSVAYIADTRRRDATQERDLNNLTIRIKDIEDWCLVRQQKGK